MVDQSVVQIIIRAKDEAAKAIGGHEKQLGNLLKTYAKVTGGLLAIGYAAKKAFDFGKAGAEVIQTKKSFDTLLKTIGGAPDLLDDLRQAAGGTVTDMKLMQSAMLLVAGTEGNLARALADATPRLLEIARAANKINPALGSVDFLFDSLSRGIKRNSPLILDNALIVASAAKANEAYAKQLGKSADALTQDEQKLALLNQVLEQGDIILQQAGGSAESATDSFTELGIVFEELKNKAAEGASPAIGGLAGDLADVIRLAFMGRDAFDAIAKTVAKDTETYEEFTVAVKENAIEQLGNYKSSWMLTEAEFEHIKAVQLGIQVTDALRTEQEQMNQAWGDATEEVEGMTLAEWKAYTATDEFKKKMDELNEQAQDAIDNMPTLTDEVNDYFDAVNESRSVGSPIESLIDDLKWIISGAGTKFQGALIEIKSAVEQNKITPEEGLAFSEELFVAYQQHLVDMGEISKGEAADNIAEGLAVPLETANELLGEYETGLDRLTSTRHEVDIATKDNQWLADLRAGEALVNSISGTHGIYFEVEYYQKGDPYTPKQHGGPVRGGDMYLVGERGPELFVPSQSGYIVPNQEINQYFSQTVHTNATAPTVIEDYYLMKAMAGRR